MMQSRYSRLDSYFKSDHIIYWSSLSRFNNLMVIMNISMFFLTGLVTKGYFYTFYSLACLGVVGVGVLVPTAFVRFLWYYGIFLALEMAGLYYLVASVVYWVEHSAG